MKTENLIGISLLGVGAFFLYRGLSGKQTNLGQVKGLNVNINPETMIGAAVHSSSKIPNELKEPISRFGKGIVNGFINGGLSE